MARGSYDTGPELAEQRSDRRASKRAQVALGTARRD